MNDDHADLKTSSAPYRAEASEAGNHDGNPKPKKKICCACPAGSFPTCVLAEATVFQ